MASNDLRITRFEEAADGLGYWLNFACGDSERFRETVDNIKRLLVHEREWRPDEKAWWILRDAVPSLRWVAPDLAHAIEAYRRGAGADRSRTTHRPQQHSTVPPEVEQALAALYLRHDAPPQVVRAAYRALAPLCHPDAGGDEATMVTLNLAHEKALRWAEEHAATDTARRKAGVA